MKREPDHNGRLEVAGRLYIVLCAQYPRRFIRLFDENGVRVSAFNKSDVPVKMHGMSAIHVIIGAVETVGPPPDRLVMATDCRCMLKPSSYAGV